MLGMVVYVVPSVFPLPLAVALERTRDRLRVSWVPNKLQDEWEADCVLVKAASCEKIFTNLQFLSMKL